MASPRHLPLFDPRSRPQSWNERMTPGEHAILYAGGQPLVPDIPHGTAFCSVLPSLADAESYAHQTVTQLPQLRCRIYDHHGKSGPALSEITGAQYKGEPEFNRKLRLWLGGVLFFGGLGLAILDWAKNFEMEWPAMIGTRLFPAGLILLVTELILTLEARRKRRASQCTR